MYLWLTDLPDFFPVDEQPRAVLSHPGGGGGGHVQVRV